jgi:ankyrin repeat protein
MGPVTVQTWTEPASRLLGAGSPTSSAFSANKVRTSANRTPTGGQRCTTLPAAATWTRVRYLLLEGADANQPDNAGRTPLFCASENGNEGIVALLVEKGANVKATNREGHTSLQLAAKDGNLDVVQKLLGLERAEQPVLVNSLAQAMTPLHFAAQHGHDAVVRLLLDRNAAADGGGSTGRTPLSYACEAGSLAAVEALLARNANTSEPGVDVNSRDESGRTPLSYAAAAGHLEIVRALMGQAKLDANVPDRDKRTPLIHAAQGGHSDAAICIATSNLEHEGQKAPIIAEVLARPPKPLAGVQAVDLDATDGCGRTALSYLAEAGHVDAVNVLVSLKASPEIRDSSGKTAADYGRSNGNDEVLKALLAHEEKPSSNAPVRQKSRMDGAVRLQPEEENGESPVRHVDRVEENEPTVVTE